MTAEAVSQRRTCSVGDAAELLGIGRNSAYEAAARGEIPTIRIGNRVLVLLEPLQKMLGDGFDASNGAVAPLVLRAPRIQKVTTTVRLPVDLRRALEGAAATNDRTLSEEVTARLADSVEAAR